MRSMKLMALILSLLTLTQNVYAQGGSSTGGADRTVTERSFAQWLGLDREIKACLTSDADTLVSDEKIKSAMTDAFKIWRAYLNHEILPRYGSKLTPSSRIIWQEKCDSATDLQVFFGVLTPALTLEYNKYHNPLGFVSGHSLWLSNDPLVLIGNNLIALSLHEVGHLLGLPHLDGTIMTDKITELLHHAPMSEEASQCHQVINRDCEEKWKAREEILKKLIFEKGLINQGDGAIEIENELKPTYYADQIFRTPESTFERFTGKAPKGLVKIKFEGLLKGSVLDSSLEKSSIVIPEFKLTLSDSTSTYSIPVDFEFSQTSESKVDQNIFLLDAPNARSLTRDTSVFSLSIHTLTGKVYSGSAKGYGDQKLDLFYSDSMGRELDALVAGEDDWKNSSEAVRAKMRSTPVEFNLIRSTPIRIQEQWIYDTQ